MSIQNFLDQDITITRLSSTSGEKIAYSEVATVRGHIQELDDEAQEDHSDQGDIPPHL